MNADARLASLYRGLVSQGLRCMVMGGWWFDRDLERRAQLSRWSR